MATFTYLAIDEKSVKLTGVMDASSEKEVRDFLRQKGFILLKIKSKESLFTATLSQEERISFTLQLSQLLEAGLPLYESLVTLQENFLNKNAKALIHALAEKVHEGSAFNKALATFPDVFDLRYCAMVQAGIASGTLVSVLKEILFLLERRAKLKKQLTSAVIYPLLLGTFAICVVFALLFFVIPSLEGLFEGKELQGTTFIVVSTSQFLRENTIFIFCTISLLSLLLLWKRKQIVKSALFHNLLLKIPFLKIIFLKLALSRFFRTLATLQNAGINLIDALRMASDVMQFRPLEKIMREALEKVIEGSFLSKELQKSKIIPHLIIRMLSISEETAGGLSTYQKIAQMYEDDVEKSIIRLGTLLQPIILIIMGLIVGVVMLSVLIPLTDVGNLI